MLSLKLYIKMEDFQQDQKDLQKLPPHPQPVLLEVEDEGEDEVEDEVEVLLLLHGQNCIVIEICPSRQIVKIKKILNMDWLLTNIGKI